MTGRIHGDAHVHAYSARGAETVWRRALDASERLGAPFVLLLADLERTPSVGWFAETAATGRLGRSVPVEEPGCITLREDRALASLVVGRQIVARERLEVLALATPAGEALSGLRDGELAIGALLGRVLESGALAVLPWGFGKWIGARGRLVSELVRRAEVGEHPRFYLGDVRARCWPFAAPANRHPGARTLAGTDPLRIRGGEGQVARYGFSVSGRFDPERPRASLLDALRDDAPSSWGRPQGPGPACLDQLRLRLEARGA